MSLLLHAGLDIGSTTAKAVVLDNEDIILFSRYIRHFADVQGTARRILAEIRENYFGSNFTMSVAGSGALELAEGMSVPFTQEQIACSRSINRYLPNVDVCIELGGEDAKLTFFDPSGAEQRMNESCAGGTGAFIDQMAALLGVDALGLNELAKGHKIIYPIASRCGVFAKTDVQPLLNDGASRSDIAASIFQAIVNQTISGLACGRKICGNVAFLGGPLYFLSELRKRFTETLRLREDQCIFPENPHLFVAMGAALGLFINPLFAAIPLFVGCGLIFAGVTDRCGMALVLTKAPWHKILGSSSCGTTSCSSQSSGGNCAGTSSSPAGAKTGQSCQ